MNYQDLYYFIKVVQKGSLISASKYLDIPTSTLSRRLQSFEQELGYKLIHRSAKKFGLTESGQRFYSTLSGVVSELETLLEDVNSELSSLSGDIKITAPVSFGHHYVKEWVFEFMEQNPKISVEMFLSNDNVDLVKNSIDIAFRIGEMTLNDWVARPLFDNDLVICASPTLIQNKGTPKEPEDLAHLPLVVMKRSAFWRFYDQDDQAITFTPKAHLRTDEIMFAKEAVKRGIGAACLPRYVVQNAVDAGDIQILLDHWKIKGKTVHIMYPHRESVPLKIRTFIDFVINKVRTANL
ncbi:LysR family transcriptional regulator [Nitrincola iocasae]|uniref:LysR family transcriptional regulator n=1 Tax=Nitrincola iocasae TaxID=2614693 RepID=A0A5J6LER8_9GAMM|nr:LysR family transcriptional regulator [Nitrincola iocasae]QEW06908.1 LysR family transcriptional regulator [Nitrincola iocasae]